MKIEENKVEKIDILKEMEILNQRARNVAIRTCTEEKLSGYDYGVKNTMACLESLITHEIDGEKDRLIYQKYGEQSDTVNYVTLSEILEELEVKV